MLEYLSLFVAAFLAATILPAASEVAFAALLAQGRDPFLLWAWASSGNTLGAAVNWGLAIWLLRYRTRWWFPFKRRHLARARLWFRRWGVWTLLLSWVPIAGDALTFFAGLMRVRWYWFYPLVFVGKSIRYALLLAALTGGARLVE